MKLYGKLDENVEIFAESKCEAVVVEENRRAVARFLRCKDCTVVQFDFTGKYIDAVEDGLRVCRVFLAYSKALYQLLQETDALPVEVAGYVKVLVYSDGSDCNGTIYYFPDYKVYFVNFESFALVELGNCKVKLDQFEECYVSKMIPEIIQEYLMIAENCKI